MVRPCSSKWAGDSNKENALTRNNPKDHYVIPLQARVTTPVCATLTTTKLRLPPISKQTRWSPVLMTVDYSKTWTWTTSIRVKMRCSKFFDYALTLLISLSLKTISNWRSYIASVLAHISNGFTLHFKLLAEMNKILNVVLTLRTGRKQWTVNGAIANLRFQNPLFSTFGKQFWTIKGPNFVFLPESYSPRPIYGGLCQTFLPLLYL